MYSKKFLRNILLLIILFFAHLLSAQELPIDKNATKETVYLYNNLKTLMTKGVMFGHQDDLAYGVDWSYEKGRSDVKESCGDYPAVYGWELGRLEIDQPTNLDAVPFEKMKTFIREAYNRGAVITISWHLNNPLTGKSAWDPALRTVESILPGGEKHELYKSWLDKVLVFLNDLKGRNGEFIPVLFRPFHELNGSWFWWGKDHCTPESIKALYRFTVQYMRDTKQCHHLLYAFNTDRFSTGQEYLERYPGDEWVDVLGFDIYQRNTNHEGFISDLKAMVVMLSSISKQHGKIPAITEFGFNQLPEANWWTKVLWEAIKDYPISYVLAWRNAGKKSDGSIEYYVPYKGQASENDFRMFRELPATLFNKELSALNIYTVLSKAN